MVFPNYAQKHQDMVPWVQISEIFPMNVCPEMVSFPTAILCYLHTKNIYINIGK